MERYLNSGLAEVDSFGQVLSDESVGVVRPLKHLLECRQLGAGESRPVAARLLDGGRRRRRPRRGHTAAVAFPVLPRLQLLASAFICRSSMQMNFFIFKFRNGCAGAMHPTTSRSPFHRSIPPIDSFKTWRSGAKPAMTNIWWIWCAGWCIDHRNRATRPIGIWSGMWRGFSMEIGTGEVKQRKPVALLNGNHKQL